MKKKIELTVYGLSQSLSASRTYAYALALAEKKSDRKLFVVIGETEAQIIALEIENGSSPRPLTHDLIKAIIDNYGIKPMEVYIDSLFEGIFSSKISFTDTEGNIKIIDSRTSDAVILAIKYRIPIYTSEQIMETAGFAFTEEGVTKEETELTDSEETGLSSLSKERLEELLKKAVEIEEYEQASLIMEEIEKRNRPKKKD